MTLPAGKHTSDEQSGQHSLRIGMHALLPAAASFALSHPCLSLQRHHPSSDEISDAREYAADTL